MIAGPELPANWDLDTAPMRRGHLECHELDGEAILYDLAHHALHYLNTSAYAIWLACDGRTCVRELLNTFTTTAAEDVDISVLRADTLRAIGSLVENGLVDSHG
jgi:hypothetical protein